MTFSRNYLTVFQKYLDIRNLELQLIFMMRDLHQSLRSGWTFLFQKLLISWSRHQISKTILRSRLWRALLKLQEKKQRERFRRFTRLPIRRKVSLLNVLQIWEQPFTTFRICWNLTNGLILRDLLAQSTVRLKHIPTLKHVCSWMKTEMFFRDVMMICHAEHRFLMEWTGRLWFAHICCLMSSFSDLRFTEPAMEIIYS